MEKVIMKRKIICLIVFCFFNVVGLFSQDIFISDNKNIDFNNALNFYNNSILEFANIFSSNALKYY
jgi:hypothetical protein